MKNFNAKPNPNVNFDFISELEGGAAQEGYVPDPHNSQSGVTIATGFDIGQQSPQGLDSLLPPFLADKLKPYTGYKKHDAVKILTQYPLRINRSDAAIIDQCVKKDSIDRLVKKYNSDSSLQFSDIPEPAQTVIASVAFQYGDLAKRTPNFWKLAINQDWEGMLKELNEFGDRYPTRRKKEAQYLGSIA